MTMMHAVKEIREVGDFRSHLTLYVMVNTETQ